MYIDELDFSARTYNCLMRSGIRTVEALMDLPDSALRRIRNLGEKSIGEIKDTLENIDRSKLKQKEDLLEAIATELHESNENLRKMANELQKE